MSARLLVLEAGSAMGNNLIRSLQAGDSALTIVGCNESAFVLRKSLAQRNYVLPISQRNYGRALRSIVEKEAIDLLIPTNDEDVARISELRDEVGCRTFLPSAAMIERCQDKYEVTLLLHAHGIPAPLTHPIEDAARVDEVFERFPVRDRLWCRARSGSGSYAAIPVCTPDQVRNWIAYWEEMRAVPPGAFTLSEYLPGRDFCVQCLWQDGRLVLAKMAERVTYINNGSPSGVSSTPALAQTFFDARVFEACESAIRVVDPRATGVFFVDVKENEAGDPCITEINAGRFATITNIHDLTGKHNMAHLYVRLAMGEDIEIPQRSDPAPGYYLVRSVDTLPEIVHGDDLYQGFERALH